MATALCTSCGRVNYPALRRGVRLRELPCAGCGCLTLTAWRDSPFRPEPHCVICGRVLHKLETGRLACLGICLACQRKGSNGSRKDA